MQPQFRFPSRANTLTEVFSQLAHKLCIGARDREGVCAFEVFKRQKNPII